MERFKFGDIVREKATGALAEVTCVWGEDCGLWMAEVNTKGETVVCPIEAYDPGDFEFVDNCDGRRWVEGYQEVAR